MRLIDAETLEKVFYTMSMCSSSEYCKAFNAGAQRMFEEIQSAPTIPAEVVVHCGECEYSKLSKTVPCAYTCKNPLKFCPTRNRTTYTDFGCLYGKPKEVPNE